MRSGTDGPVGEKHWKSPADPVRRRRRRSLWIWAGDAALIADDDPVALGADRRQSHG
jgi:hypothetical protein